MMSRDYGKSKLMKLLGRLAKRQANYLDKKGFKGVVRVSYGSNSSSVRVGAGW